MRKRHAMAFLFFYFYAYNIKKRNNLTIFKLLSQIKRCKIIPPWWCFLLKKKNHLNITFSHVFFSGFLVKWNESLQFDAGNPFLPVPTVALITTPWTPNFLRQTGNGVLLSEKIANFRVEWKAGLVLHIFFFLNILWWRCIFDVVIGVLKPSS